MDVLPAIAGPLLMGLFAVGVVLSIKIARRRGATRSGSLGGTVPANPLSAADARRMIRRYAVVAALLVGVLTAFALAWRTP